MTVGLERIVAPGAAVFELPTGFDIGGGEGLAGKGCDGLIWAVGRGLLFSDAGHSRRLSWTPAEGLRLLHASTSKAMGAAIDADGAIIACEFESKRITRRAPDGALTILVDRIGDAPLAGPDDVVVGPDGAVWFTDVRPPFPPSPAGTPPSAVYRIAAGGGPPERVAESVFTPGGLAFAPDGRTLYISDSAARTIVALDVASGRAEPLAAISGDRFQTAPCGLAVDELGDVYSGGPGGIWVTDKGGGHVGVIASPATTTTNLCFGGTDNRTLFFSTCVAVGGIELQVSGAPLPGDRAGAEPAGWGERKPLENRRRVERADARIDRIISASATGAAIEELGSGGVFNDLGGGATGLYARSLEGTVWDAQGGYLFFSDIGNSRRLKWTEDEGFSVLTPETNHTNGATLDATGAIISAEHKGRRISRLARDGGYSVLADRCEGKLLGRCNDVIVRSDGNIYFTAPWWDFGAGDPAEDGYYSTFFHLTIDGRVVKGPAGYRVPNGLAFTPDETILYVNDSYGGEKGDIKAYDVAPNGEVDYRSERVFFSFSGEGHGTPDGMKVDLAGNVYCGGPGGLWIISPEGTFLGKIVHGATQVNNLTFGGPDWKTLYFCSWSALFRIRLLSAGVPTPRGGGVS